MKKKLPAPQEISLPDIGYEEYCRILGDVILRNQRLKMALERAVLSRPRLVESAKAEKEPDAS